ncbi:MAG: glycosyltransferase family 4 protein [Lachnospiraceae bacterium]|jgi:glycosyltransferase involved in cell wall biosynthesis|nr:glycosyltransferase family 4 protein [Lachnospiraceae bacterium]
MTFSITFVSNYINHHQLPFCDACFSQLGDGFVFIQTQPMETERLRSGWSDEGEKRGYLRYSYGKDEAIEEVFRLIDQSDVVLAGWCEDDVVEAAIQKRVMDEKLTFRISERIFREGRWKVISPRGLIRNYHERTRHRRRPYYLLSVGSYTAGDFRLIQSFPGKKYRWGYFPATIHYGEELWQKKQTEEKIRIVWAGRFIPLKRPEQMIRLLHDLRRDGHEVVLDMIGGGEMEEELREMAARCQVSQAVNFHGVCPPQQVREIMEEGHIFVLTSNRREGWGAVLNEAMNSGCAVVASSQAGATGFLIDDGVNGFAYHRGSYKQMYSLVKRLCDHPAEREQIARRGYQTITEQWNGEDAATELLICAEVLLKGDVFIPPLRGLMSEV